MRVGSLFAGVGGFDFAFERAGAKVVWQVEIDLACRSVLRALPSESVQCVVTSPPYWGLRDYGLPPVEWSEVEYSPMAGLPPITVPGLAV